MFEESRIMRTIDLFRDSLWPGGQLKPYAAPRSPDEKTRTRDEANRKLSALIPGKQFAFIPKGVLIVFLAPDLAANMIGRSNARRGARRIFAVLQNRRLNQHIAYTVLDEVNHLPLLIIQ